jgi:hypothetical protein
MQRENNEIGSVIIKYTLMELLKEGDWNEGLFGRIRMYNLLHKNEDVKKEKLQH